MRYPQAVAIISDDCIDLVFFWTKISALALQTHDGKECLFLRGPVLLVLGLVIPLCRIVAMRPAKPLKQSVYQ